MTDKPIKVEALSIVDHIHRTLTGAETREAAHDKLSGYHDMRFNHAMRKYNKTARKLGSAQEGTAKHDSLQAQMQHHLSTANYHQDQFNHHVKKAINASYGGYQDRANQKKEANHAIFKQNMLRQQKNSNKRGAIFKPKTTVNSSPTKPIVAPRNNKVVTPVNVPNVKPNKLTNKLVKSLNPVKTNLKKPIHIQSTPKNTVKQAAKLNIKAQPTIKPIKPVKIKPIGAKLPKSPTKMRATPV